MDHVVHLMTTFGDYLPDGVNPIDYLPGAYHVYKNYYTPYEPYIRPVLRYFYYAQYYTYRYIFPYIYPVYRLANTLLAKALSDKPDLVALALLAIVLLISMKLLDMLRRSLMYWISFAVRIGFWLGVGLLGVYAYHRGLERSIEDLGWLLGYLGELESEGDRIGKTRAKRTAADARRVPKSGPNRGRSRGGGW